MGGTSWQAERFTAVSDRLHMVQTVECLRGNWLRALFARKETKKFKAFFFLLQEAKATWWLETLFRPCRNIWQWKIEQRCSIPWQNAQQMIYKLGERSMKKRITNTNSNASKMRDPFMPSIKMADANLQENDSLYLLGLMFFRWQEVEQLYWVHC